MLDIGAAHSIKQPGGRGNEDRVQSVFLLVCNMAEEEFDRQTGLGRQTGEGIRQFIIVRWTGDDRLDRQSSEKTLPEREVFLKQQALGIPMVACGVFKSSC